MTSKNRLINSKTQLDHELLSCVVFRFFSWSIDPMVGSHKSCICSHELTIITYSVRIIITNILDLQTRSSWLNSVGFLATSHSYILFKDLYVGDALLPCYILLLNKEYGAEKEKGAGDTSCRMLKVTSILHSRKRSSHQFSYAQFPMRYWDTFVFSVPLQKSQIWVIYGSSCLQSPNSLGCNDGCN